MERDALKDVACANLSLLEEQYATYMQDPSRVDRSLGQWFEQLEYSPSQVARTQGDLDLRALRLIDGYRVYGHLMATDNPLNVAPPAEPPQLKLESYGISQEELAVPCATYRFLPEERAPLQALVDALKETYCGKIGIEYVGQREMEQWLQMEVEPAHPKALLTAEQKQMILEQLNRSELFETYLHTRYVGQKRFSLEGAETLIPMLLSLLEEGDADTYLIGMAHRGRLNVLCNIFNKSYADIFSEFGEQHEVSEKEGSGDVKYHKGFSADVTTTKGKKIHLELAPNPSHLEAVDPVIEGMTRAWQDRMKDEKREKAIPILIHGDAALTGQGVIFETLQFNKLQGYTTGGTLHFVINNQIGFTTLPRDLRSTCYCTDIARGFGMPVFHVNAEDPEACVYATLLALKMRQKFHVDVFVDLICYRKYGHNEGDEPAFTQPKIYQLIRKKKSIRQLYQEALIAEGVVDKASADALEAKHKQALKDVQQTPSANGKKKAPPSAKPIETAVAKATLESLTRQFCKVPENFKLHPKIVNGVKERLEMGIGNKPVDWGMGETLAYATLLADGKSVRISGQDCCRGTFSHRHALWIDQETEEAYIPLQHIEGKGHFEIYNSPLSENAVLGFEFGYSVVADQTLTIWEAQFGDFSNGAQTVIDQFIVPSEQKWGQISSVTLFLPHGYEGQGPEHSSARMERYLSLAGDENVRIANPTTPAQFFHLLRRQALDSSRKPLIIFTPKGLLRHPACVSPLASFEQGRFEELLDDPLHPKKPKKLVLCSGRIYYELSAERAKQHSEDVALLRLEQLYPLPVDKIKAMIEQYRGFEKCLFVQEEPANMGAWPFISQLLDLPLTYVGRPRSAATAVGSHALHNKQQAAILEHVFKG